MAVSPLVGGAGGLKRVAPRSYVVAVGWPARARVTVLTAREPMRARVVVSASLTERFARFYVTRDTELSSALVRRWRPKAATPRVASAFS